MLARQTHLPDKPPTLLQITAGATSIINTWELVRKAKLQASTQTPPIQNLPSDSHTLKFEKCSTRTPPPPPGSFCKKIVWLAHCSISQCLKWWTLNCFVRGKDDRLAECLANW